MWLLVACIMIPVYYLALLAFSHAVFPFIPAIRGGGDYTVAPRVVVYLKDQVSREVLGKYLDSTSPTSFRTIPIILLEETATALFIASADDAGGPCSWRLKPEKKPQVLSISRDLIAGVQYFSAEAAYSDCPQP
jgi:hypothetical protein